MKFNFSSVAPKDMGKGKMPPMSKGATGGPATSVGKSKGKLSFFGRKGSKK